MPMTKNESDRLDRLEQENTSYKKVLTKAVRHIVELKKTVTVHPIPRHPIFYLEKVLDESLYDGDVTQSSEG